jgi:UDP-N-acetylmuramoyl-tripeptide--D-alanyl-D-alanine ligase
MIFINLLSALWFLKQIKSLFFWSYLWQLKEYHIGRFIDHFRTEKGKKIFLNFLFSFKIFLLLIGIFSLSLILYPLFLVYLLEALKFIKDFLQRKILTPVFTKKILFLISLSFLFLIFFLFSALGKENFPLLILLFDVLNCGIFSGIFLIFQPVSFLFRYQTIRKATKKREGFEDLLVIGVTGSFGKTSTKEFLATILEEKFPGKILKTKEHQNSEVGISKCILEDLKENHKIFIVEMGAYNKGGISLLAKIAKPKIAILTGVNEQHLSLFGSMENLISAEGGKELIESLPKESLAIFNGENEILKEIFKETKIKKKIVGIEKEEFDLRAKNIKVEKEKISFEVFSKNNDCAKFELNLIGVQNVENILLAACCAKELGMNLKEISKASRKISQEQSGVRLIKSKNGFNVIDSTYSANPDSVFTHLEYLKVWGGKKAIVMPCLIELGEKSKEIHRKIGQKIAQVCDLAIIVTKDYFKEIKEAANEKAIFLEKPELIFEKIKDFNGKDDIVLLEGRLPLSILHFLRSQKI